MSEKLSKREIFARNLSRSGYGMSYDQVLAIAERLSDRELDEFSYTCYRTAEKLGADAFDCDQLLYD